MGLGQLLGSQKHCKELGSIGAGAERASLQAGEGRAVRLVPGALLWDSSCGQEERCVKAFSSSVPWSLNSSLGGRLSLFACYRKQWLCCCIKAAHSLRSLLCQKVDVSPPQGFGDP